MGVHQESAGCLVRMGGDAAHRPAGGYVDEHMALPWEATEAETSKHEPLGDLEYGMCCFYPRGRDVLLEISKGKMHDCIFNLKSIINKACPRHELRYRHLESCDDRAGGLSTQSTVF